MAEYIERGTAIAKLTALEVTKPSPTMADAKRLLADMPTADVAPVVHGRCPICSGRKILTQDCDNGYSVEVDAEQGEMSIWQGDTCLTVISIDYCPNCGARMDDTDGE